jgi:hypothetical protein
LKPNASSHSYEKRVKELERVSTRIAAKMVRLRKIVADISKNPD